MSSAAAAAALPWPVHRVGRRSKPVRFGNQALKSYQAEAEEGRFCAAAAEQKLVRDVVLKQASMAKRRMEISQEKPDIELPESLTEAYHRCREICAKNSRTYYLGSMLLTPERQRAVWAIYAWGSRMDELVDGPADLEIKSTALESWEARLEDIFRGCPLDIIDAALSDTVSKFPIDIQLLKDLIWGMKTDLWKSTYNNFDELYLYSYLVTGTAAMMIVPVLGLVPYSEAEMETFYNGVLALAIGNQLANILRDVGEDARRGRIYLPQDELAQAGLSGADIFAGKVTEKWRDFMKKQIERARKFYDDGEKCVMELNSASRLPVLVSLMLSRQILNEIEANDYNNFTKVASVCLLKKILALPLAYVKSLTTYPSSTHILMK